MKRELEAKQKKMHLKEKVAVYLKLVNECPKSMDKAINNSIWYSSKSQWDQVPTLPFDS